MDVSEARTIALSGLDAEEYDHFGKVAFRLKARPGTKKPGRTFMTLWLDEGHAVLMLDQELQTRAMEEHPEVFVPHPSKWGEKGSTIMRLERTSLKLFREWAGRAAERAARA